MIEVSTKPLKNIVIKKPSSWPKLEAVFFLFAFVLVIFSSLYMHDCIFALISSACGIIYTILAGKGKVYCYPFGIIGTLCCAYISYDIALYGNCILHFAYYFPMEIIGFFSWKKHLDKSTNEIIKEKLSNKELSAMILLTATATVLTYIILSKMGDKSPLVDASMTVLSVTGMVLTVRRSIEQWVVWTFVNLLSIIMWFNAYIAGEKVFSLLVVRVIYFVLGIYFFIKWKNTSLRQIKVVDCIGNLPETKSLRC